MIGSSLPWKRGWCRGHAHQVG